MSFYDDISARLAALTGSATPVEARDALNEFNVRDIEAVRVSEGGGGGGGGGATLIGPFTFQFDDAHLGDAISLATIAQGMVVVKTWIEIVTAFVGPGGGDTFTVGVGGASWTQENYFNTASISVYNALSADQSLADVSQEAAYQTGTTPPQSARVIVGPGHLTIAFSNDPSGLSAGEANVYALIAGPL